MQLLVSELWMSLALIDGMATSQCNFRFALHHHDNDAVILDRYRNISYIVYQFALTFDWC